MPTPGEDRFEGGEKFAFPRKNHALSKTVRVLRRKDRSLF